MNTLLRTLILTAITALLASCAGKKATAPAPPYSSGEGYEAVEAQYEDWIRLRVPLTLRLRSPKTMSIGGTATMIRDTAINISLRMLGMEIAILDITPDSVVLADKIHRQYVSIPVGDALGKYGFSAANVQDLLTGRIFLLGATNLTPAMSADFEVLSSEASEPWILRPRRQPAGASYIFAISPDNTLSNITITPDGHKPIGIPFNGVESTARGVFAREAVVTFESKKQTVGAALEWNWDKARFDSEVDAKPFVISSNYRRIDLDELLKSFK